ncbi:hypothetical protein J6590_025547 [Homalodisca vitripennis]|nr:hypothetical protein J6590_025547 [Homalodisca vitripennis]
MLYTIPLSVTKAHWGLHTRALHYLSIPRDSLGETGRFGRPNKNFPYVFLINRLVVTHRNPDPKLQPLRNEKTQCLCWCLWTEFLIRSKHVQNIVIVKDAKHQVTHLVWYSQADDR